MAIFTNDQRAWLESFAKQYKSRLGKRESGRRFALERAEEFVEKWNCGAPARRRASRALDRKEGRTDNRELDNKSEPSRNGRRTQGNNLRLSTIKRKEIGGESSSEEPEEQATVRDSPDRNASDVDSTLGPYELLQNTQQQAAFERGHLLQKLDSILRSHTENTGPASFYLLLAHPPIEPNNPPVLSKLQSASITDFPNFGSYFRTDEEHIYRKWKEYATAVERKHGFRQKLKQLIALDEKGYPQVPVMGYDLKELGEALTVYLERTWYKLHEHIEDITITTIPWSEIEFNPAQYLRTSALLPSLIPFEVPNRTSAEKIIQLHSFLKDNAHKPFRKRFPFIVQSKVPGQSNKPMPVVIMVNNKTRPYVIARDASSMGEMSDEVTPTKRR